MEAGGRRGRLGAFEMGKEKVRKKGKGGEVDAKSAGANLLRGRLGAGNSRCDGTSLCDASMVATNLFSHQSVVPCSRYCYVLIS